MQKYQDKKVSIRLILLDMKIFWNIFSCLLVESYSYITSVILTQMVKHKFCINFMWSQ